MASKTEFPGVNDTVNFGTGASALDIGYRWYRAHDVTPLFPFGFGLSYTTFSLSDAAIQRISGAVALSLTVTNTGAVAGADVVQAYVDDPVSAGEPPEQLRAFSRVSLAPAQSRVITMTIPIASLQIWSHGEFKTVPGAYGVNIGNSSNTQSIHLSLNLQ